MKNITEGCGIYTDVDGIYDDVPSVTPEERALYEAINIDVDGVPPTKDGRKTPHSTKADALIARRVVVACFPPTNKTERCANMDFHDNIPDIVCHRVKHFVIREPGFIMC